MGRGGSPTCKSCAPPGGQGRFQNAPRGQNGTCRSVPRDSYISAVGANQNFDGDIESAFSCIAPLGITGCGFEHQLQSVRVALDPDLMPPENRGFLREEAILAIILLTDEDDCSAPADTTLFDPSQTLVSDPLGPLTSYRCNEFGHLCNGQRPPRTAASNLQNCHSAEDGRLIKVSELVAFFKNLKANPNDVMVAAVTGPATPYSVTLVAPTTRRGPGPAVPTIVPSCMSANGTAAPAVRIKDFVDAFGDNGTFLSICADDFSPVMTRIGQEVARRASLECLVGRLVDVDPNTSGVQPHCEVFDETSTGGATLRESFPACAVSAPPCWRVQASAKCIASGLEMIVDRNGAAPPPQTRLNVICETCDTANDPRCK